MGQAPNSVNPIAAPSEGTAIVANTQRLVRQVADWLGFATIVCTLLFVELSTTTHFPVSGRLVTLLPRVLDYPGLLVSMPLTLKGVGEAALIFCPVTGWFSDKPAAWSIRRGAEASASGWA